MLKIHRQCVTREWERSQIASIALRAMKLRGGPLEPKLTLKFSIFPSSSTVCWLAQKNILFMKPTTLQGPDPVPTQSEVSRESRRSRRMSERLSHRKQTNWKRRLGKDTNWNHRAAEGETRERKVRFFAARSAFQYITKLRFLEQKLKIICCCVAGDEATDVYGCMWCMLVINEREIKLEKNNWGEDFLRWLRKRFK